MTNCVLPAGSPGYLGNDMAASKRRPVPDRHSAYAPGKKEWKKSGNRLTAAELHTLTDAAAKAIRLRPARRAVLHVR